MSQGLKGGEEMSLCIVDIHGDIEGDYEIIKTFPEDMTNGQVLKAMFPRTIFVHEIWSDGKRGLMYSEEWWKRKYDKKLLVSKGLETWEYPGGE
jgi:hypothetical protein